MDCLEFRRTLGADPGAQLPDLRAHESQCTACGRYAVQLRELDVLIGRALRVDVEQALKLVRAPQPVASAKPDRRYAWLGLAAGIVLALSVWLGTERFTPASALPGYVVAHAHHEPQAMVVSASRVSDETLLSVVKPNLARIQGDFGHVSYAKSCWFRGRWVPHLVIQRDSGPVMVLLLRDEQVGEALSIDADGFSGSIVPVGQGSIAIVGHSGAPMKSVEKNIVEAVEWSI